MITFLPIFLPTKKDQKYMNQIMDYLDLMWGCYRSDAAIHVSPLIRIPNEKMPLIRADIFQWTYKDPKCFNVSAKELKSFFDGMNIEFYATDENGFGVKL
jgi:hypothetical protein